jgi:hypothetical protein
MDAEAVVGWLRTCSTLLNSTAVARITLCNVHRSRAEADTRAGQQTGPMWRAINNIEASHGKRQAATL